MALRFHLILRVTLWWLLIGLIGGAAIGFILTLPGDPSNRVDVVALWAWRGALFGGVYGGVRTGPRIRIWGTTFGGALGGAVAGLIMYLTGGPDTQVGPTVHEKLDAVDRPAQSMAVLAMIMMFSGAVLGFAAGLLADLISRGLTFGRARRADERDDPSDSEIRD